MKKLISYMLASVAIMLGSACLGFGSCLAVDKMFAKNAFGSDINWGGACGCNGWPIECWYK